MMKQPRVVVKNTAVIHYNINENSASRSAFSNKYLDILFYAEQKQALIQMHAPEYAALSENVMVMAHMALLKKLIISTDPRYRSLERTSLRYVRTHRHAFISAGASDTRLFRSIVFRFYHLRKFLIHSTMKSGKMKK